MTSPRDRWTGRLVPQYPVSCAQRATSRSARVLGLGLALLAAPAASAQISLAGFVFDDDAGPEIATVMPGGHPEFAGVPTGCAVAATFPGQTMSESAQTLFTSNSLDHWVFGKALVQLDFVDNAVVNGPGADLVVFEIGGAEGFALSVFFDAICEYSAPRNYTPVSTGFSQDPCGSGTNAINAAAIDLSDYGVLPGATVRRLLIDSKGAAGGAVGADIALVMALESSAPVTNGPSCVLGFQQGVDGGYGEYLGTADTCIASDAPATNFGAAELQYSDSDTRRDLLVRFDGIIGPNAGQIAPGSNVTRALLHLSTGPSPSASNGTHGVYRVLQPWNAGTITWANGFGGNGIDADGVEAAVAPVGTVPAMGNNATVAVDVTAAVQAWADGAPNRGLALLANTTDGLGLQLAEALVATKRPALSVEVSGNIGYATAVASFAPGVSGGFPWACYLDASQALGAPDLSSSTSTNCNCAADIITVSLGVGGAITLEFGDVSLSGDDSPEPDLWIYERGPDVEDTFVEVSADGVVFHSLGKVFGSVSSVDLDALGFGPLDLFRYVRLTDDPNEGDTTGCSVGADIDAVAVLSPNPWVNLGHALAGSNGPPHFAAAGALVGDGLVDFSVSNGTPNGSAYFVLGITNFSAPFKGGVMVPHPDLLVAGLPITGAGNLSFSLAWPTGLPAGIPIFIQFWMQNVGGPFGFAATNALTSLTL